MEPIEQLKTMRDQAKSRIETSPDYRLMTKLTTLIDELESTLTDQSEGSSEATHPDSGEDEEAVDEDHSGSETEPVEAAEEPSPEEASDEASEIESASLEAISAESVSEELAAMMSDDEEPVSSEAPAVELSSPSAVELDNNATSVLDELERLTGALEDGEAQHAVELTQDIDPLDEVSPEAASLGNGFDHHPPEYSAEEAALDADLAIMRALPQLEADLTDAYLEMQEDEEER